MVQSPSDAVGAALLCFFAGLCGSAPRMRLLGAKTPVFSSPWALNHTAGEKHSPQPERSPASFANE